MGSYPKKITMIEKLLWIHLLSFIWFFIMFWVLEYIFPLRKKVWNTTKRWLHNIWLSTFNTLVSRILLLITPVSVWLYIEKEWIWLLNIFQMNFIVELVFSVIILDFIIYFQHVLSHRWKWFWRLHSIHHSDTTLDVSTGIRFHTLEIMVSLLVKIAFVVILWLNPISVVIFEILLVSSTLFNHSNLRLPDSIDTILSSVIVTPDFHQVHHSTIAKQTNSNYGFFLSIWDKIFRTYTYHKFRVREIWLVETKNNLKFSDLLLLRIKK